MHSCREDFPDLTWSSVLHERKREKHCKKKFSKSILPPLCLIVLDHLFRPWTQRQMLHSMQVIPNREESLPFPGLALLPGRLVQEPMSYKGIYSPRIGLW